MISSIRRGVYPTMITPYAPGGAPDLAAIEKMVEFYVSAGCDGIFAVCQSSEMFFLSEEEKRVILKTVLSASAGRLDVVASGHTADDFDTQIRQLASAAECGAAAPVIVLNRLAREDESDDALIENLDRLLRTLPDIAFGVYECPYPYKRLASGRVIEHMAGSGRIVFLKDTCCDIAAIRERIRLSEGSPMTIYNANTATLLDSLRAGAGGYSGVMANFHPDLYVELFKMHAAGDLRADTLQAFLTTAALIERQMYPANAKRHMHLTGIDMEIFSRSIDMSGWRPVCDAEVRALAALEDYCRGILAAGGGAGR